MARPIYRPMGAAPLYRPLGAPPLFRPMGASPLYQPLGGNYEASSIPESQGSYGPAAHWKGAPTSATATAGVGETLANLGGATVIIGIAVLGFLFYGKKK